VFKPKTNIKFGQSQINSFTAKENHKLIKTRDKFSCKGK